LARARPIQGHCFDRYTCSASFAAAFRRVAGVDHRRSGDGTVVYVPANHTISNEFAQPIPFQILNAANFAASGEDVVIPQGPGILRAGIDITSFSVTSAPEPATWMMLLLGLGAVGLAARRRPAIAS
jgi:MYXO-CTERM domain-containing protein